MCFAALVGIQEFAAIDRLWGKGQSADEGGGTRTAGYPLM